MLGTRGEELLRAAEFSIYQTEIYIYVEVFPLPDANTAGSTPASVVPN